MVPQAAAMHQGRLPDTAASSSGTTGSRRARYYRPELDVIRCLAFLLVLTHHLLAQAFPPQSRIASALHESGAAGVCLFFTLSAFLITELLLREQESTGTVALRAFYLRRILRIWPLYFLAIGLGVALPHGLHTFAGHLPKIAHPIAYVGAFVLPYLLLVGNWAVVAKGFYLNPMMMPLWSISVEEQFYCLWPTAVKRLRLKTVIAIAAGVLVTAWLVDLILPQFGVAKSYALWCNSLSQFQFFALGALLAISLHGRRNTRSTSWRFVLAAASVAFLLLASNPFHFEDDALHVGGGSVLAGYLCLDVSAVLLFFASLDCALPRAARPLIYLGKISYGLYVFHDTVLSLVAPLVNRKLHLSFAAYFAVAWVLSLLLTTAIASCSYYGFEKPFLRLKERFEVVPSRST